MKLNHKACKYKKVMDDIYLFIFCIQVEEVFCLEKMLSFILICANLIPLLYIKTDAQAVAADCVILTREHVDARDTLTDYVEKINRELAKKRKEFEKRKSSP